MANTEHMSGAAIALNRFGLGARTGQAAPADPKGWLLAQLDAYEPWPAAWAQEPGSHAALEAVAEARRVRKEAKMAASAAAASRAGAAASQAAVQAVRKELRDTYVSAVDARMNSALATNTPFVERLVHFWANHFAVSADKPELAPLAGAFEAEAIRPYVLGSFEDMLVAVESHPAMQIYLDQVRSVGPNSPAALRAGARNPAKKPGLNENLARAIMELHTLGVRTGYTQDDVTEFARALTGWSIAEAPGAAPAMKRAAGAKPGSGTAIAGTFVFRPALHEPGERTVMGRRYAAAEADTGATQALAVLHDLARAPATARHIGLKLARHFSADNPSPAMVGRLAHAFEASGGDLPSVYRALVASPEAWQPVATKFKSPWDWTISACRGIGLTRLDNLHAAPLLAQLGQPVWRPGSPAGYDDTSASWAAPDALMRRVELAQRIAARVGESIDPRTLAPTLLAGAPMPATAAAIAHAESVPTALALLLVSPDFQRR
jgi:uncharacterized protein (DUF1800 family)